MVFKNVELGIIGKWGLSFLFLIDTVVIFFKQSRSVIAQCYENQKMKNNFV